MRLGIAGLCIITMGFLFGSQTPDRSRETKETPTSYADIVGKHLKEAMGKDYRDYEAVSYPTDNFGVLTIYSADAADPRRRNFECATWSCLGVSPVPALTDSFMTVRGLADIGQGGPVKFSDQDKSTFVLTALLPKLFAVLGLNNSYSDNKVTIVSVDMGGAWYRQLDRPRFFAYMDSLPAGNRLHDAFQSGRLSVVVGDVVLKTMNATVTLSQDLKDSLDAKLMGGTKVGDSSLGMTVAKSVSGQYTITNDHPVIVLRAIKRQSGQNTLQKGPSPWSDWKYDTRVPEDLPSNGGTPIYAH